MGFLTSAVKLVKKTAPIVKMAAPLAKIGAKAIPGVGAALAVYEGVNAVKNLMPAKPGMPKPPGTPAGVTLTKLANLPPPPMAAPSYAAYAEAPAASSSVARAPAGGKRLDQMTTAELQAMDAAGERIPFSQLKTCYKSPRKGFVILRVGTGVHCLRKDVARRYGWKPGHKPPISVGQYQAMKKAARAVDKFHQIEKDTAKLLHFKNRVLGRHHHHGGGYQMVAKPSGEIVIPKKGR